MKKELSWDYDISAKNMLDFTKNQEIDDFKISVAEFEGSKGKTIKRNVLAREEEGEQIFHMTDGKYILERSDGMDCEYYYSEKIEDLIDRT